MQNNKVAIYCRLSKEDGSEESQSIASQREVLINYANQQGWKIYDIYIDDGYSGTNFDRPGWKELQEAMENGTIKVVITKSLSRLGRSNFECSYFLDYFFPTNNIRYIAMQEQIDTAKKIAEFKGIDEKELDIFYKVLF